MQDFSWRWPEVSPNHSPFRPSWKGSTVQSAREWVQVSHCLGLHTFLPPSPLSAQADLSSWNMCSHLFSLGIDKRCRRMAERKSVPVIPKSLQQPISVSKPSSKRYSLTGSEAHSFCISSSSYTFGSREKDMQESCTVYISLAPTEPLVSYFSSKTVFTRTEVRITPNWHESQENARSAGVHCQNIAESTWGESRVICLVRGLPVRAKWCVLSKYCSSTSRDKVICILSPYDHVKLTVGFNTQVEEDGYR